MSHPILENFQFRRLPFQADIDAGALYAWESFEQGRRRLRQAARDRGMVLVTGDFGAGKTALVRAVTSQLASSSYRVLYLAAVENSNPLRPVVEGLLDQLGEKVPVCTLSTSPHSRSALGTMAAARTSQRLPPCQELSAGRLR